MIKIFPFIVKTFGLYGSHKRKLFPFMYLKQSAHRVDPKKLNETHLYLINPKSVVMFSMGFVSLNKVN